MHLEKAGMEVHDLTPEEVKFAHAFNAEQRGLSSNDCMCIATALSFSGVLLTGDKLLRKVAECKGLVVHGVIWIVDALLATQICKTSLLSQALKTWLNDAAVFLPRGEICKRLKYINESE